MSICLSVYLSIYLSIYLSLSLSIYIYIYIYIYTYIYIYIKFFYYVFQERLRVGRHLRAFEAAQEWPKEIRDQILDDIQEHWVSGLT